MTATLRNQSRPRNGNNCSVSGFPLDREITAFCVSRGGKCFAGWPVRKLHAYVVHHLNRGTAVFARRGGRIAAALFVWPVNLAAATGRAQRGEASFLWREDDPAPDGFLLAEVVGTRAVLNAMEWPELGAIEGKTILTYRRGKLVVLNWATIKRFLYTLTVRKEGL